MTLSIGTLERVDKATVLERYLVPIVQPGSKLWNEAQQHAPLKQAMGRLHAELQAAGFK